MKPTGELGVYIHFPYCRRRCPYCDFRVDVVGAIPHRDYERAVLAELELRSSEVPEAARLQSIYFGGGTPSLWEVDSVARIIDRILIRFAADPGQVEVTIEANPTELVDEDAASSWFRSRRAAGINRVSLGIQSFDDESLRFLGRRHDGRAARAALSNALSVGQVKVSADLIAGLPDRPLDAWRSELASLLSVPGLGHISVYELTIHDNTPFGRLFNAGRLRTADDAGRTLEYETTVSALEGAGLRQYEVSNFAREGQQSRHNSLYWSGADYLGLGVGAHSLQIQRNRAVRRANTNSTADYLGCGATSSTAEPAFAERLEPNVHLRERLFLGLRTLAGVDLAALEAQLEIEVPSDLVDLLDAAVQSGMLTHRGRVYQPTPLGLEQADCLAVDLV